ncbi:hypothetical protein GF357_04370 [Candidatus Dojkabacteria bacterium]|nr:hypothetical protein [Candidatus Dojkabacteria bacterium]
MKHEKTDLVIIGSGPAGLAASIYAGRYRIRHVVIGKIMGGLITESHKVCNYPGFRSITGIELGFKMKEHAEEFGGLIVSATVDRIERDGDDFKVITSNGDEYLTKYVLVATGTKRRKLNAQGESEFLGKGVTYCATCDGMLYKDKIVAVLGGADSATTAAIYLADIAKKVYIIYRREQLRGEPIWVEQVLANKKIEIIYNTNVTGFEGKDLLQNLVLDNPYNGRLKIPVNGAFIEIGSDPDTSVIDGLGIQLNTYGYIKVKDSQMTNIRGIYAAGDITDASNGFQQVITAAAEGAVAAESIFKSLKQNLS